MLLEFIASRMVYGLEGLITWTGIRLIVLPVWNFGQYIGVLRYYDAYLPVTEAIAVALFMVTLGVGYGLLRFVTWAKSLIPFL